MLRCRPPLAAEHAAELRRRPTGALLARCGCCSPLPLAGAASCCSAASAPTSGAPTSPSAPCGAAFVFGADRLLRAARPATRSTRRSLHLFSWIPVGGFQVDVGLLLDPLSRDVRAAHHRRRLPDPRLLDRLHGARPAPAAVLRLPQPVRRGDAAARPRRQLPRALRRLGGRRPRVVPAHRVLVPQARARPRRRRRRSSPTASATSACRSRSC